MIALLSPCYFYYIMVSATGLTTYTELGPFGTWRECQADQRYYRDEMSSGTVSECYQR